MMRWLAPILLLAADLSITQDPSAAEWRQIGLGHISSGELKSATPALEQACELEEKPSDSCCFLARNLHAPGEFEAARKALDVAMRVAPRAIQSRVCRAAALNYSAVGMTGAASASIEGAGAAVQGNRKSARANLEHGRVLLQLDRLEAGRRGWEQRENAAR